jgi:hypothetical protein
MKKNVIASLLKIASVLDENSLSKEADIVEDVLIKIAQNQDLKMWTGLDAMDQNSAMNVGRQTVVRPGESFYSNDPNLPEMPITRPELTNNFYQNIQIMRNWLKQPEVWNYFQSQDPITRQQMWNAVLQSRQDAIKNNISVPQLPATPQF